MPHLKFRYTLGDDVAAVRTWLESQPAYIVIRHAPDADVASDHWHAWISTTTKIETLRAQFKKACSNVDRTCFSLGSVKDGEEEIYIRYMCHGSRRGDRVEVVCMQAVGYSIDRLQELHEAYWDKNDEYKEKRKPGAKKLSQAEEFHEYCTVNSVDTSNRRKVTVACVEWMGRRVRSVSLYHLEGLINGVLSTTCRGRAALVEKLMEKYVAYE